MASIQERLQIKREPLDKWSIREQLCLAVARKSDQNLTSVSRVLKQFAEPNRPSDWFNQKNCAAQYHALLANCETPKRKKRASGGEVTIETPAESILKKLTNERKAELKRLLAEEKAEYTKLQADLALLQSGNVTEEQLDIWCKEIDEEERRKEQEAIAHAEWLRERELRKQEIERAWRPVVRPPIAGQKRKNSDSIDCLIENDSNSEESLTTTISTTPTTTTTTPVTPTTITGSIQQEQPGKLAPSPLLTSLLKSPSQVPNVTSSSILHSAITNQRTTTSTNPMISSLLNSSANVQVSPSLQHLVSTAIGQQQEQQEQEQLAPVSQESIVQETDNTTTTTTDNNSEQAITSDILDDANLPNIKIDDLANSILVPDGPLPEMKNDVDVIISDLIENAQDIVNDPEQHLQLDGNGDLNLNLELEDFEDEETESNKVKEEIAKEDIQKQETVSNTTSDNNNSGDKEEKLATPVIDPFEFKEEDYEQTKNNMDIKKEENETSNDDCKEIDKKEILKSNEKIEKVEQLEQKHKEQEGKIESSQQNNESANTNESIEIPINDNEIKQDDKVDVKNEKNDEKPETIKTESTVVEETLKIPTTNDEKPKQEEIKNEIDLDVAPTTTETTTITPDFNEELYDDLNMEVKVDKSGKAKRDYSRTKKKEDKEFDVLLTIEKVHDDVIDDGGYSDKDYDIKDKLKIKNENERSNSPWTEEDDGGGSNNSNSNLTRVRRRVSTPIDSIPNSPVSSSASYYEDDREYRNWKKSVMLVYNRLAANKYASIFSKPITDDQAPGYHSIVYRPMDLLTIRKNIENGTIRTTQEFQRDVLLMFNNAIMYNKTNDTIYNMARQMQQESIQQIQILLQAQQQMDVPSRRETRTSEPGCKRKRGNEDNIRNKKRKDD